MCAYLLLLANILSVFQVAAECGELTRICHQVDEGKSLIHSPFWPFCKKSNIFHFYPPGQNYGANRPDQRPEAPEGPDTPDTLFRLFLEFKIKTEDPRRTRPNFLILLISLHHVHHVHHEQKHDLKSPAPAIEILAMPKYVNYL